MLKSAGKAKVYAELQTAKAAPDASTNGMLTMSTVTPAAMKALKLALETKPFADAIDGVSELDAQKKNVRAHTYPFGPYTPSRLLLPLDPLLKSLRVGRRISLLVASEESLLDLL